jgi:alpha-galactosidase
MPTTRLSEQDCYAEIDEHFFVIGNDAIARRFYIGEHNLLPVALEHVSTGRSWLVEPSGLPEPSSVTPKLELEPTPASVVAAAGLRVRLTVGSTAWSFELWPKFPAIRMRRRFDADAPAQPTLDQELPTLDNSGIERPAPPANRMLGCALDRLSLAPRELTLTAVTLRGITDRHYELVQPKVYARLKGEAGLREQGNLFAVDHSGSGEGFAMIRYGMLPHSTYPPRSEQPDLLADRGVLQLLDSSTMPDDDGGLVGDWQALVMYTGGAAGRTAALQQLEQRLRIPRLEDRWMVSNTWGDRSRDSRVTEAFLLDEAKAAADLGVDVLQIDDGWQAGRSSNSAEAGGKWFGFWEQDDFWTPHPDRLPRGLDPILNEVNKHGFHLGLWYAPDRSDDFANWQKDAQQILQLHREHDVNHFKIDAVVVLNGEGEANYHRLLDTVLCESDGRIVLDLDATAGKRPDYLGRVDAGPVFVENRYTDWGNYYPHLTLRSLWQLSQWMDPARLRMEWLNPDRNRDQYDDDSPLAPSSYPADYLFAITMAAAPLAWMEVQHLAPERVEQCRPLIELWHQHRDDWVGATTLPIGSPPDGFGWAGFLIQSVNQPGTRDLLLFRENAESAEFLYDLQSSAEIKSDLIYGPPNAEIDINDDKLQIKLPDAKRFAWVRLS